MKETISPPVLNEDQHRALSARLAMLDYQLAEAEIFICGVYPKGEMFEIVPDISPAQSEELLAIFRQVRERIKKLRERFGLTIEKTSVTQKLAGSFSILWTILEDTRAAKLKGFGDVAPELSRELDPEINSIIALINDIKQQLMINSESGL